MLLLINNLTLSLPALSEVEVPKGLTNKPIKLNLKIIYEKENNTSEKPKLNVVFVGHVDHGKSTLIGRLLFDTDSLPNEKISEVKTICKQQGKPFEFAYLMDHMVEEREQNITIDTAQVFFKTPQRDYVIIDAPGHIEFIKNMITGASQAEAAILIVDTNEGVQEQTKRHAKFLSLLGLNQVIVVLNKMDLEKYGEEKFKQVKKDIIEFLDKINIKPSFVIPISAMEGDNIAKRSKKMEWYKDKTVLEALDTFKQSADASGKSLRFPVQDLYKFSKDRIIAGQISSGVVKVGDEVVFLPKNNKSKIKTIEKYGEKLKEAAAGECIGITLEEPLFIDRGNVMVHPDSMPKFGQEITGSLFWMTKEPLKKGENYTLQCSTQETDVVVEKISHRTNSSSLEIIDEESDELGETEVATVTLKADDEIVTEDFNDVPELGRFTLSKNGAVMAGGIITKT